MNSIAIFVLGLLAGWVIEWIVDWIYWRSKMSKAQIEYNHLRNRLAIAEEQNTNLKNQLASQDLKRAQEIQVPSVSPRPDDLEVIIGIGPVIAAKLNQAGICTFEELAALKPERLRELVGDSISRLADEESIITQAKALAAAKEQGG
jgi:predicted flap endonuclease-1-like 5' DNA nuclease